MPSLVPATLKSISPSWSSSPMISVKTACLSPSNIRPIATPATSFWVLTPAALSASEPPQTLAIELEPLLSKISETTLIVYGDARSMLGARARLAKFPCPSSRLPGALSGLASPTLKPGKL